MNVLITNLIQQVAHQQLCTLIFLISMQWYTQPETQKEKLPLVTSFTRHGQPKKYIQCQFSFPILNLVYIHLQSPFYIVSVNPNPISLSKPVKTVYSLSFHCWIPTWFLRRHNGGQILLFVKKLICLAAYHHIYILGTP